MRSLALFLFLTLVAPAVHHHHMSRGYYAIECARSIVIQGMRNTYYCCRANPEARIAAIARMSRNTPSNLRP